MGNQIELDALNRGELPWLTSVHLKANFIELFAPPFFVHAAPQIVQFCES